MEGGSSAPPPSPPTTADAVVDDVDFNWFYPAASAVWNFLRARGWAVFVLVAIIAYLYHLIKPRVAKMVAKAKALPDVHTDEDKVREARRRQYERHVKLGEENMARKLEEKRNKLLNPHAKKSKATLRREFMESYPDYDFSRGEDRRTNRRPMRCLPRSGGA